MSKKVVKILLILTISVFGISFSTASLGTQGTTDAILAMQNLAGAEVEDASGKMGNILNSVIAIIQVAGTGISMIMVTLLGIKYILASPSDKADVKKQIAPMVIGAVILFASVNLVGIIADVAVRTLSNAAG